MSQCIVSCGVGQWYPRGVKRLERSLLYHGWGGAMQMHIDKYPEGSPTHQEVPYAFKLNAIQKARSEGHDQVLWLDSCAWAIKRPHAIFDRIETEGHYFWTSGYACDTWCNNRSLNYFGISREEAKSIPMLYALVIGLDFRNHRTRQFFDWWQNACNAGVFNGSWKREEGDPDGYEGHRHDQSAASLIAHKLGMGIDGTHDLCHLYEPNMPSSVELVFQGM